MTETALKVGQPVKLVGKDVVGTVAFIGATKFAPGKWIGVVLEEACGRNNGTVESVVYFKCEEKHGLFVRQTQLEMVGDDAQGTTSTPAAATPTAPRSSTGKRRIEPTSLRRKPQGNPVPQKPDRLRLPIAGGGSSSGLASIRRTPSSSTGWRQSDTDLAHARQLTPGSKEASPRDVTTRMSASFVEAGFVESRTASTFSSGRTEERVNSQELDNLRAEVKDLTEKLETLRIKRAQDKEKLKEAEKLRLLVEQHSEFKSRIMESQAALQRELVAARNEARDASESRQQTVSDTQDLADTVEMLTLDKEMAEERAETLQLELEQARETIEELTVDLEILKEAASGDVPLRTGAGEEVGGATLVQVKQLEQQNQRLHDTLVKMRDVAAHEKHELQKANREAEARRTELSAASRAREVLDQQLIETRAIIADLQEQVDAALGAEDMVETLTERNLELEEHMLELEEQVRDLEDINYTNDLLVEGAKEQELELREDLDLSTARLRETERERDALGAVLVDRDATIAKFRDLVQTMTEQNTKLRADLTAATNRPVGTPSEVIDFKKLFSETKAHSAAIDLELRELELQQARDNVTYLKQYLPDNFMTRGGDQDSVSVLLLLPRVIWKAEVVLGGAAKFPPPDAIDRVTVLRSHQTDQYAFACRLRYLLHSIQSCAYQLQHVATRGTVLQLLALGGLYSELAGHERALDQYVELLRKDQLDENVGLDVLERAVSSLAALQRSQLSGSELQQALLLSHLSRATAAAAEAADINTKRLIALLQTGCEGEAGVFCSSVSQCCLEVMSAVKRIKRRLPQDGSAGPVTLPEEVQDRLQALAPDTARAAAVMRHVVRAALQQMSEGSEGIPGQKIVELIHEATDALYGAEDQGPESVSGTLQATQLHIASIASSLENGEFDYDGTPSSYDNATPPIVLRAQHIKAELKDSEHIKNKMELREQDLRELRLLLKQKNESLSEMTVRRDLAEKRVVTATKDADVTIEKLQRHLDDTMLLLRRKEKEYEETLDHLQSDIESLESEKGELREKLKAIKKRSLYDAAEERNTSLLGTGNSQPVSAGAAVQDSPALLQQISDLRTALRCAASAASRDTACKMRRQLAQLPPIAVCRLSADEEKRDLGKEDGAGEAATNKHSADALNTLAQQTARLKKELAAVVSNSCVVELSGHGGSSVRQLQKQRSSMAAYSATVAALQNEVVRAVARQRPGGAVYAALRSFPSLELSKARAQHASLAQVGQLTVAGDGCEVVPVVVQPQHIHLLHSRLLS